MERMTKNVLVRVAGAVVIAMVVGASAAVAEDVATRAQTCGACHGENGVPINAMTPIIFGQQSSYLYKQLHDYKSGDRANPIMAAIVKEISFADLRALATYVAGKSWPPSHAAAAAAAPEGIAMCRACHQPNFEGGAPAPRLAGLSYDYLVASMRSFADGERTNNLDMPGFMKALSDDQRVAMAKYLAGL
jgi:cytochrome c553